MNTETKHHKTTEKTFSALDSSETTIPTRDKIEIPKIFEALEDIGLPKSDFISSSGTVLERNYLLYSGEPRIEIPQDEIQKARMMMGTHGDISAHNPHPLAIVFSAYHSNASQGKVFSDINKNQYIEDPCYWERRTEYRSTERGKEVFYISDEGIEFRLKIADR